MCPVATSILTAMNVAPYKRNWTRKAPLLLQSHSSALLNFTTQWNELEDHFNELQKLMTKRFEELARKTKEYEKEKKSAIEKITVNPDKSSEKNCASENRTGNTSRIPEKKFTALKTLIRPRRKIPPQILAVETLRRARRIILSQKRALETLARPCAP